MNEDISSKPMRRMAAVTGYDTQSADAQRFVLTLKLTFSVATHAEAVDESSGQRNDVLERARERNASNVLDGVYTEHGSVKDRVPQTGVFG